ncbi:hypothetical protein CAC42_5998 [Sphaceloma murrayae]|uniref:Protein kinase domain-containing protein n=1 Tax=Sphaceloma murrayae TaxID=2082308 RepID=A0A2K1QZT5_9PEZI|nr:hypothetical protein CAC42_5998 [Sphaceloma murrayae]
MAPPQAFRCLGLGSTVSALYFLEPASPKAIDAFNTAQGQASVGRARLFAGPGMMGREARGYIVRIDEAAGQSWAWTIGSGFDSDLRLPDIPLKAVEIRQLGHEDEFTGLKLSTIIERHSSLPIEITDALGDEKSRAKDLMKGNTRCLVRPSLLDINGYTYNVYVPGLDGGEERQRELLLRSIMTIHTTEQVDFADLIEIEFLGSGSYGIVTKWIHLPTGKVYAVKEIFEEVLKRERKEHRIPRELQALRDARHPNVIRSLPMNDSSGQDRVRVLLPYMPFTLAHFLKPGGERLDALEIHRIMLQVLRGIVYLHVHHSIVHRDLKPNNILLHRKEDGTFAARVSDLGFAVESHDGWASSSDHGAPRYACPQLYGRKVRPDFSADVYSFAITYFESVQPRRFQKVWHEYRNCSLLSGRWAVACQQRAAQVLYMPGLKAHVIASLDPNPEARPSSTTLLLYVEKYVQWLEGGTWSSEAVDRADSDTQSSVAGSSDGASLSYDRERPLVPDRDTPAVRRGQIDSNWKSTGSAWALECSGGS